MTRQTTYEPNLPTLIADPALAAEGEKKISWASAHMPVLSALERSFAQEQPFSGLTVAVSIHLEAKTAYLASVLHTGGARVFATGSNPLSTQDDVCAGLAARGVTVYASHGCDAKDYDRCQCMALCNRPDLLMDDGGDMMQILHGSHPEWSMRLLGGMEETTTGVLRLRGRAAAGTLRFPMINVNDADCKHLFDNRYGTGQSVWDGIMRTTNLVVAGKTVVVAGYGWCGKGVAMRAKGLGARVIVTEVDAVKAIEAVMDGFAVMPMADAAPLGDFFVTVTGCCHVITVEHMLTMKEGAILSNAGHFDVEVDMAGLREAAVAVREVRHNILAFTLANGRTVCVLAEGRLVNLAAGDGHPAEIMDMSFALQALSARYFALEAKAGRRLAPALYPVPREIDERVAAMKLEAMGFGVDALSDDQRAYLGGAY